MILNAVPARKILIQKMIQNQPKGETDLKSRYENFENLRLYHLNLQYLKSFIKTTGRKSELDMKSSILEKHAQIKKSEAQIARSSEDIFATKKLMTIDRILDEQEKFVYATMLSDIKKINGDILNLQSLLYKDEGDAIFIDDKVSIDYEIFNATHRNLEALLKKVNSESQSEQNLRIVAKYKRLTELFQLQLAELKGIYRELEKGQDVYAKVRKVSEEQRDISQKLFNKILT